MAKKESKLIAKIADIVAQVKTYREFPVSWDWFHAHEYDQEPTDTSQLVACERFIKNYKTGRFFYRYIKGKNLDILSSFVDNEKHNPIGFIEAIREHR